MTKLTIKERINNYQPLNLKDKMKFNFIVEHLKETSENHIKNISQLQFPKQEWKSEVEYTCWLTPKIKTYFLCYIDLESPQYFGDLKNVFGNPIPTKKKTSGPIPRRNVQQDLFIPTKSKLHCINNVFPIFSPFYRMPAIATISCLLRQTVKNCSRKI